MNTPLISTIAAAALVLGTVSTAMAQAQRGAPAPRVAQASPQLKRCIQFSHRAYGTCIERAQNNIDLKRQCQFRLQKNVIGCRQRYR